MKDGGFIYFAQFTPGGPIKIGYSKDPERRLSEILLPDPFVILAKVPGSIPQEYLVHQRLQAHRHRGEWYVDCDEVRAVIAEVAA